MYVNNKIIIYKSRVIDYEISKISNGDKRRQVEDLYDGLELENIPYTYELDQRVEELEKYNIQWIDNSVDEWFDLDIFNTDNTCMSDTELTEYFDTCNNPWHCYENGRMYGCNFDRFATKAGLNKETENSYFDLNKMNEGQKKEFLEFTLNYNNNGYVELCKHCAGWAEMNKNKVPVAIQC